MTRAKQRERWSACSLIIWVVIFHCFRAQGQTTPTSYVQAVTSNSPSAYWRLNETNGATVAQDFFGVYNGAIGSGVTAGVPGPQSPAFPDFETNNTAMQLNYSSSSYLTMPALNLDTNTVTITGWINPTGVQAGWAGVVFCRGGSTVAGLNFGPGSIANELRYTWNNDRYNVSTGLVVPPNQWSFFALVVTPGGATIYLGANGALNSFSDTTSLPSQAFDASLLLGFDPASGSRLLNGLIDEVALYNHALSPSQIQQLYTNAGSGQTNEPIVAFSQPFNITNSLIWFQPGTRQQVFRESDTVSIQTSNNQPITIFDVHGNVVYQGGPTSLPFLRGHYFVETDGDRNQFAVLPNDYVGASFLGTDADNGWNVLSQKLQQIQPTWVRTGAAQWDLVQPQRGVWDWSQMDIIVSSNINRRIIAVVAWITPSWVQASELVQTYTEFVQTLATRYKGQLAAIEIWNEPWYNKFPGGTNLDLTGFINLYLQLHASGRQASESIDPNVMVVGPCWSDFLHNESLAITTNSSNMVLFDAWTWHDYNYGNYAPDQNHFAPAWVLSISKENLQWWFGDAAVLKPMFVDEIGLYGQSALGCPYVPGDPPIDWYVGMCRAIKVLLLYRAAGVSCLIPSLLDLANELPNPNSELDGWDYGYRGPHPKTSAFLMASYWLNGATLVDFRTPGLVMSLYAWQRTNNTSAVFAWALEGTAVPLLNNTLPTTDIYGRSHPVTFLTQEPVLFQSTTLSPSALLSNVMAELPNLNIPPVFSTLNNQAVLRGQNLQFTVSATDSNNNPLTYSVSPLPAGASLDPLTGVFSWTPATNQVGTYTLVFTASDDQGVSSTTSMTITVTASLSDGLAHYWSFNEGTGTTAADSIGASTGTLLSFDFNSVDGWAPGISGSGLNFKGITDYVNLNNNGLVLTNNFSISAWINPRDAVDQGAIINIQLNYLTSGLAIIAMNNGITVTGTTTAGSKGQFFSQGAIQNGSWYHIVVVYNNSTVTLYINGVNQGSVYWGGDIVMNPSVPSSIGYWNYFFNGIIDEVKIYSRVLSSQDVLQLYQSLTPPPLPVIESLSLVAPDAIISFTTVLNALYEVDYRNDAATGSWMVLTNGLAGTGGILSVTDPGAASLGKRFYRVGAQF